MSRLVVVVYSVLWHFLGEGVLSWGWGFLENRREGVFIGKSNAILQLYKKIHKNELQLGGTLAHSIEMIYRQFSIRIILILEQAGWDEKPDLCMDTFPKLLKFEFELNIDKMRNLDKNVMFFWYNYTHLNASMLKFKPSSIYRCYS